MKYADLNKVLKNLSTTVFCRCGHLSFLAFVVVVRCLFCFFQLFFSMLFAYGDVYMKQMSTCLLRQRIYIYIYIYISK